MFEIQQQEQLNHLIRRLQQRYGERGGRRADQIPRQAVAVVSSGFAELDAVLPGGGLPRGALTLIRGAYGVGATSLALQALARSRSSGGLIGIIDLSHTLAPSALAAAGLPLEELVLVRPSDGATALLAVMTLVMRRVVDGCLIDSLAHWQHYRDASRSLAFLQQRLPRLLSAGDMLLLARAAAPPLPAQPPETAVLWSQLAAVEITLQPRAWLRHYGVIVGSRVTAQVQTPHHARQSVDLDLPLLGLEPSRMDA